MLDTAAKKLLERLDHVTPSDGAELSELDKQRGWVEAIRHLEQNGCLNAAGQTEAAKLIAATDEWVDGLPNDLVMPPVPEDEGDVPVVVSGP